MRPARARSAVAVAEVDRAMDFAPPLRASAAAPRSDEPQRLPLPPRQSPIKDAIIRWLEREL